MSKSASLTKRIKRDSLSRLLHKDVFQALCSFLTITDLTTLTSTSTHIHRLINSLPSRKDCDVILSSRQIYYLCATAFSRHIHQIRTTISSDQPNCLERIMNFMPQLIRLEISLGVGVKSFIFSSHLRQLQIEVPRLQSERDLAALFEAIACCKNLDVLIAESDINTGPSIRINVVHMQPLLAARIPKTQLMVYIDGDDDQILTFAQSLPSTLTQLDLGWYYRDSEFNGQFLLERFLKGRSHTGLRGLGQIRDMDDTLAAAIVTYAPNLTELQSPWTLDSHPHWHLPRLIHLVDLAGWFSDMAPTIFVDAIISCAKLTTLDFESDTITSIHLQTIFKSLIHLTDLRLSCMGLEDLAFLSTTPHFKKHLTQFKLLECPRIPSSELTRLYGYVALKLVDIDRSLWLPLDARMIAEWTPGEKSFREADLPALTSFYYNRVY